MNTTSSVKQILPNTNTKSLITSDSDNLTNTNTKSLVIVRQIADKLVLALNNPDRFELYCKFAWRLSEAQIWNNLEQSARGRNQTRLFTWLCQNDIQKQEKS